jgi:hypothetical protein
MQRCVISTSGPINETWNAARCRIRIFWSRIFVILFTPSMQTQGWLLKLCYNFFLPVPLWFLIHWSSIRSHRTFWATDNNNRRTTRGDAPVWNTSFLPLVMAHGPQGEIKRRTVGRLVNNELQGIWKGAILSPILGAFPMFFWSNRVKPRETPERLQNRHEMHYRLSQRVGQLPCYN